jgi:hypothetical protein
MDEFLLISMNRVVGQRGIGERKKKIEKRIERKGKEKRKKQLRKPPFLAFMYSLRSPSSVSSAFCLLISYDLKPPERSGNSSSHFIYSISN